MSPMSKSGHLGRAFRRLAQQIGTGGNFGGAPGGTGQCFIGERPRAAARWPGPWNKSN